MDAVPTEPATIVQIAQDATKLTIRHHQQGDLDIHHKSSTQDLVTRAEVLCQDRICEWIRANYPHDSILAEEQQRRARGTSGRRWVVYPLHGTSNSVHADGPWDRGSA